MSSRWIQLIRDADDANTGAAVMRLATMAAALHQAEWAKRPIDEHSRGADGSARTATVPHPDFSAGRAGNTEVAR